MFVEAHTVGQDNWTTLPDLNGHTTQVTGESRKQATRGLDVFVDDIEVSTGEGTTSFETGMDGWTTPGAPAGERAQFERLHSDYAGWVLGRAR